MDREFLNDLENTLPELWEKIDAARKEKEKLLIKMLSNEQKHGNLRMDLSPELLAPLLLTLIRGMYNPTFFLSHNVTSDTVSETIIEIFLHGSLIKGNRM